MKKTLMFFIIIPLLSYLFIEIAFVFQESKPFDFAKKEWIHHSGFPENTIEGLKSALAEGYQGIEIDVFYLPEEKRFIVTHDLPFKGQKLYLEDFLKEITDKNIKLWLDFKNAQIKNVLEVAEVLALLETKYGMKDRLLIESQNHLHQVTISRMGFPTILWVNFHNQSRLYFFRNFLNRLSIVTGNFVAISFPIEAWQEGPKSSYQKLNKLIFTVNDLEKINELKQDPTIKVILKDLTVTPVLPH